MYRLRSLRTFNQAACSSLVKLTFTAHFPLLRWIKPGVPLCCLSELKLPLGATSIVISSILSWIVPQNYDEAKTLVPSLMAAGEDGKMRFDEHHIETLISELNNIRQFD